MDERDVDQFCRAELRAGQGEILWVRRGAAGVLLDDGRRVVIHRFLAERALAELQEMVRLQMHLASRGLWAPTVVAGPAPLGRDLGVAEAMVEAPPERTVGGPRDAAAAAAELRALAAGLWAIVEACRPMAATSGLPGLTRRDEAVGERVIGHGDWRAGPVRVADGRLVAAFGWRSLCCEREPVLAARSARHSCDPSAFLSAYEEARSQPFSTDEQRYVLIQIAATV